MKIKSGKLKKPFAVTITGPGGVGKTSLCANAPNPIFIPTEEVDEIDSSRFDRAKTYEEFISNLDSLCKTKHDYKTVVIDSLDQLEVLLHKYLIDNEPKKIKTMAMAYGGYGSAYKEAFKRMNEDVKDKLIYLRDKKNMNVMITTHCHKKTETDPVLGATFESYTMNVHKDIGALFFDWVSAAMFCTFVTHKIEDDNSDKTFLTGEGERVMFTSRRPGFSAKNRYNMPSELPLDFNEFYKYYENFYAGKRRTADQVRESMMSLMKNVADETLKAKVIESVEKAGDNVDRLESLEKKLVERVGG